MSKVDVSGIFTRYDDLKTHIKRVADSAHKIPSLRDTPVFDTWKAIGAEPLTPGSLNNAHIVLNSGVIMNSGRRVPIIFSDPSTTDPDEKEAVQQIVNESEGVQKEANALQKEVERITTEADGW
jgi:hypothetical protein